MDSNKRDVSYLPACWDSDERMSGLMAMFKRRDVNPAEYDAKMRFWTDLIVSSSSALRNPFFTLKQLSGRFQRKDRVPAGLETVVREMVSHGSAVSSSDYEKKIGQQGWITWGLDLFIKRPLSWVWSASTTVGEKEASSVEYVLPSVVEDIAQEVLKRRREALEADNSEENPLAQDVVPYSALRRSFKTSRDQWRLLEDRALEAALSYLQCQRQIAVETSRNEKVIKFKQANQVEPPKMTDSDRQIMDVKRATTNLENELSNLEQQADRLEKEARVHVRAGNRVKAKTCLKQKLLVLKRIKEKEAAFDNLTTIMHQLAQTKEQKAIFDAFASGVAAFKNNLAKHGLSAENVDKTMDDIHEALSDHEDIRAAMASGPVGFGGRLDTSQEELEQELNELIEADEKNRQKMADKRAIRLPDIPIFDDEVEEQEPEDPQEDRLKRLRRALETS